MWNHTSIGCNYSSSSREPYRTITLTLLRIYPILFILIGTVGNLLSVYVVLRSKLRRHSTFIYLAFLSIVDLIVLYTFCINFIFHAWFNIDLQQVSLVACKIYSFSIYFFPQASAWILTAVSIDRVLALTRGVRKTRKIRLTYIILTLIFLILFVLNIQFLFYKNNYRFADEANNSLYRIVDTDMDINVIQCSSENSDEYKEFYQNIWVYVDAIVNVYLPFTLMFLCSAIIFISVFRTMDGANNTNKHLVARSLSKMLLSINTMFVLLTGPIVLYLMVEQQTFSSGSHECDIRLKTKYKMIKLLFIILMNANHTGNILVYCLTGTEFRRQLFSVLGKHKSLQYNYSVRQRIDNLSKQNVSQLSRRRQHYCMTARAKCKELNETTGNDLRVHRYFCRNEQKAIRLKNRQLDQQTK